MANFNEAYLKTLNFEGGYSNDPDDVGGETYKGVARNYHPNWKGWELVDSHRDSATFKQDLTDDEDLQQLVKEFYKANFWDVNGLDNFSSQIVANEMFDTGVNMGVGRAAKFIQISLNFLNKNGSIYEDLEIDGKLGNKTFSALKIILDKEESLLYKFLNVLQAQHYMNYMKDSPTQEKFARGWFSRVEFIK